MRAVQRHRPGRLLTSWIAILAMLMVALAPAISQALGAAGQRAGIEVCSSSGPRWVESDPGPAEPAPHLVFEHCPYCSLHVDSMLPLPAAAPSALALRLRDALPLAFLAAPHRLYAWVSAQPRGPPARA